MVQQDSGKITAVQYMFSITCFIQSSSLLTSFFINITKQDSWMAVIAGLLLCIPFLFVFIALMKRFPGMNLIQINDHVFGRIAGKIVSALYIWFFLTLTSLNLRDLSDFVHQTIMPKTPSSVIMAVFMLVCAWAVAGGVKVVIHYNFAFAVGTLLLILIATTLTANMSDYKNLFPMFDQPAGSYVQATHIISTIPFGELVVFLMITPDLEIDPKKIGRYFIGGYFIGGVTLLVVVLRDTLVLGNSQKLFSMPSFETLRMSSLMESLNRLEILFAILLIILLFTKITFLYYVTMKALTQLLGLQTCRNLILSLGTVIIVYAFIVYPDSIEHAMSASRFTPVEWTLFEFLLPLITLVAAKLRKLPPESRQPDAGAQLPPLPQPDTQA